MITSVITTLTAVLAILSLGFLMDIIPTILSKKCFSELEVKFINHNIKWIKFISVIIIICMMFLNIYEYFT